MSSTNSRSHEDITAFYNAITSTGTAGFDQMDLTGRMSKRRRRRNPTTTFPLERVAQKKKYASQCTPV